MQELIQVLHKIYILILNNYTMDVSTHKMLRQTRTGQKQKRQKSNSIASSSYISSNKQQRLSKVRKSKKSQAHNKNILKRKECNQNCRIHQFQLKPFGYSNFLTKSIAQPINVNFCISKSNSSTFPIPIIPKQFINEPQIPLFVLQQDKIKYQKSMGLYRKQLQQAITKGNKMVDSQQQKQILIAVPKTKNCQVCRVKIDTQQQFLRHTNSIQHRINVNRSLGHKLINQQVQNFQKQQLIQNQISQKFKQLKKISEILKESKKMLKGLLGKK